METVDAECPVWEKVEDTRADGATRSDDATNEAECQAECIGSLSCVGFDLDRRETQEVCWLHTDLDNIQPEAQIDEPGVDLYILQARCPEGLKYLIWN